MKVVALISAPQGSEAFPDKLLASVNGKSVIQNTYGSVKSSGLFSDIVVVTDSEEVEAQIKAEDGNVSRTRKLFDNCIERLAEMSLLSDGDIFVCIPGDHLKLHRSAIEKLLQVFDGSFGKDIRVASIVQKIHDSSRIADPNTVKVALSLRLYGLYFSHGAIPFMKNTQLGFSHYEHINIVACRKDALLNFIQQPASPLERAEQIDCLRFVENGVPVKMVIEQYPSFNIHTAADMPAAAAFVND